MASTIIMNNKAGNPLNGNEPVNVSGYFTPHSDETVTLVFSGSVWTESPESLIGIQLQIGGKIVAVSKVYANQENVHMATVPAVVDINLPFALKSDHTGTPEEVEFIVSPLNSDTMFDVNDYFTAYVIH